MIYCAFLDPESITAADDGGGIGSDHLIGVMRNLLESCFLAETSSWRLGHELLAAIGNLPDQNTRLKMNALLETFKKRHRFVDAIDDSTSEENLSLGAIAIQQHAGSSLDIIITEYIPSEASAIEVTSITRYNRSNFEQVRQRLFANGCEIQTGTIRHDELYKKCFGRMLEGGEDFTIEDYYIGKEFSDNYYENLPYWCEYFESSNRAICVTIITQQSTAATLRSLERRLSELTDGTKVTFQVSTVSNPRHERFFRSTAFSLNIGRGIDLCDERGMNRDISIRFSK